ncbi:hypothetical protein HMPREF6123_0361 [Oribacterium sinus F0268]|uniref:Uncharacterized protein n=1 Tax=Oribacterium sinus F0268 TaxID=585501 RepID=C2KV42_9FIRM|nr:hypothetical protein HMPREF6123_0361 [Oribacterium sinus F0268]
MQETNEINSRNPKPKRGKLYRHERDQSELIGTCRKPVKGRTVEIQSQSE